MSHKKLDVVGMWFDCAILVLAAMEGTQLDVDVLLGDNKHVLCYVND